jgi:hypothetical protein
MGDSFPSSPYVVPVLLRTVRSSTHSGPVAKFRSTPNLMIDITVKHTYDWLESHTLLRVKHAYKYVLVTVLKQVVSMLPTRQIHTRSTELSAPPLWQLAAGSSHGYKQQSQPQPGVPTRHRQLWYSELN